MQLHRAKGGRAPAPVTHVPKCPYPEITTGNRTPAVNFPHDAEGRVSTPQTKTVRGDPGICAVQSAPIAGLSSMTGYLYNADGVRVAKGAITTMSCDPATSGFQLTQSYVLGQGGVDLTESYNGNNQLSGSAFVYDNAGDVLSDGTNYYSYDGDGRVCALAQTDGGALNSSTVVTLYIYDAEGNRVAKGTGSPVWSESLSQYVLSCGVTFTPTKGYVIGPSGENITETDGSGNPQRTDVFAGGMLIATYQFSWMAANDLTVPPLSFEFNDWLGTRRVETNYSGTIEQSFLSYPYGDTLSAVPNSSCSTSSYCYTGDATERHYTGKERDAESGNDYFGARYYGSSMGRFLSPDPENFGADIMNPQSWNMYSYAGNNPLINFDPDGRECVWDDGSYDSKDDPDSGSADKCAGLGGTWISDDIFENSQYYRGDWSGDANSMLSGLVGDIQSCSAAVGGGQAASLIVADSFASGFSNDQTAYALGTASYESGPGGMGSHMTEMGSPSYFSQYDGRMGNTSPGDGYTYRGRGYVQLTGKWSYNYWTNQIGQNLVQHPSLAATPDTAAEIMVEGFDRGSFRSGNSIQDYVNSGGSNFVGARAVVNGGGDQAQTIANAAAGFSNSMSGCR